MDDAIRTATLESLVASFNLAFGHRLLQAHRDADESLDFEDFVRVADAVVGENPKCAAIHLAGLVALDVANTSAELERERARHN